MNKINSFLEYEIRAETIVLGERIKGGVYRPCCKTLRWSTITSALRKLFGNDNLHAIGLIDKYNTYYFTYSPQDKVRKVSRVPIQVEVLINIVGRIYIVEMKDNPLELPQEFNLQLGALISKGFGNSQLKLKRKISSDDVKIKKGTLATRIPEKCKDLFLIKKIMVPIYGYLFEPISETSGKYIKSLFEGSEVVGSEFLLKKDEKNEY
ncbi:hypothetical protein DRN69_00510 [Candidatus Pacearchaeota archaeon]|nr:MAG: hypothetical protein DRN69_00510 [Candidatus Pacearchaeota archaeon]